MPTGGCTTGCTPQPVRAVPPCPPCTAPRSPHSPWCKPRSGTPYDCLLGRGRSETVHSRGS
eukprot:scaffold48854_cov63-Phaeocystis_antarctica.AAC.9